MTGELKHVSVSSTLSQAEWEDANTHYVDSSAQGDILRLTSSGGIQRLAAGSEGAILVSGGTSGADPSWLASGSTNQLLQTTSSGGTPAWSNAANLGGWVQDTIAISQSSAVSTIMVASQYCVVGKIAHVQFSASITSSGTSSTGIYATVPAAIAPRWTQVSPPSFVCGHGVHNSSGTSFYLLAAVATSSSRINFISNGGTTFHGSNPAVVLSNVDTLTFDLTYEIAT